MGIAEKHIKGIWFGGGEPFLYGHLEDVMKLCRKKRLKILVTTNGTVLNNLQKLVNLIDVLVISLHSHKPEIHNTLTQSKSSYQDILKTVSFLKERRRGFYVNCVCNAHNYKELPEFAEYIFAGFGDSLLGLQIFSAKYQGRALENKGILVKHSDAALYLKKTGEISRKKKLNIVLRDFPLCIAPESITARRYPNNYLGYIKRGRYLVEPVIDMRKNHPDKCYGCRLIKKCSGLDINYIEFNGVEELKPL